MNTATKWIGGATLAVVASIALALVAGRSLEAQGLPDAELAANAGDANGAAPTIAGNAGPEAAPLPAPVPAPVPTFDPEDPFVIKRVLPIDGPIRYGEWHWDDEGVPDGPLRITVDLEARVISVFRHGYEIGAAAALLGTPSHPTPLGTFPILTKERHNVSNLYNNAPMPWTLRLTWDGVAIHGGSTVELGYASHGCVSVPDEFASRLFDIAKTGDIVIITDGKKTGVGGSLAAG